MHHSNSSFLDILSQSLGSCLTSFCPRKVAVVLPGTDINLPTTAFPPNQSRKKRMVCTEGRRCLLGVRPLQRLEECVPWDNAGVSGWQQHWQHCNLGLAVWLAVITEVHTVCTSVMCVYNPITSFTTSSHSQPRPSFSAAWSSCC